MVALVDRLQRCFQLHMQEAVAVALLVTAVQIKLVILQMVELAVAMEDDAVLQIVQLLEITKRLDQEMLELQT
jgi:hypothetical protein